jgi:fido (protein-threonine AMPylation protein)
MYRLFRQAYKDKAGLWRVINVSAEDVPFTNYDVLERELSRDSYRVTKNALSAVR